MATASGLKPCSVGIKVGGNCYQLSYCRKQCIYNTTELDEEQVKIMKRRAGTEKLDTVCHHHLTIFFQSMNLYKRYVVIHSNVMQNKFPVSSITFS